MSFDSFDNDAYEKASTRFGSRARSLYANSGNLAADSLIGGYLDKAKSDAGSESFGAVPLQSQKQLQGMLSSGVGGLATLRSAYRDADVTRYEAAKQAEVARARADAESQQGFAGIVKGIVKAVIPFV